MNPTIISKARPGSICYEHAGDLTSSNADKVRKEVGRLLSEPAPGGGNVFRLDLTSARMVDSAGLNVIVGALKAAQAAGLKMEILYSQDSVYRVLAFTRLDQHIALKKL